MQKRCRQEGLKLYYPPLEFCTDNAAIGACTAHYRYLKNLPVELNAVPQLRLY